MTTPTARYALNKIVLASDNVDVVNDFNVNWDAIDLRLGSQVCTSSTRPSSPVQGVLAFETDTGYTRVYKGSAWQTTGNAVSTSGSRPANPIQGDELYESDTGVQRIYGGSAWKGFLSTSLAASMPANPIQGDLNYVTDKDQIARYTGSAWRYTGIVVCTSSTHPTTNLSAGTEIYETDTNRFLLYNGTTFIVQTASNFVCTSSTHPSFPFTGLEIFETDTGLNAVYNGSNYLYAVQQIAPTQTLGALTASVTFSSIPSGITRLVLFWRTRGDQSNPAEQILMQLNGDTGSHYVWQTSEAHNTGSAPTQSGALTTSIQIGTMTAATATASYFSNGQLTIDGVNDGTNFPTCSGYGTAVATTTNCYSGTYGGVYAVAAKVTSVKIFPNSGNFLSTSDFSVFAAP